LGCARGAITVVVAHRPSAIAGVDYILVLTMGRQQKFGPKEENPQSRHVAKPGAAALESSRTRRLRVIGRRKS